MAAPIWRSDMQDRTCAVDGCERPVDSRGWCLMHYKRWWKHGDPAVRLLPGGQRAVGEDRQPCSVDGCARTSDFGGMCRMHYYRNRKTGDVGQAASLRNRG